MKRWLRNLPLRIKIALFTSVILSVSLFTLTLITIQLEEAYSKNDLEEQAKILLNTLPYSLRDELYFIELDELKEVAIKVGQSGQFERFVIYDRDGIILADSENKNLMPSEDPDPFGQELVKLIADKTHIQWSDKHLRAGQSVFLNKERIGAVSVTISTKTLKARSQAIVQQSIIISFLVLSAGGLSSFILARQISNPLLKLKQEANEMAGDKKDLRVKIAATDEIGELGLAFNEMAESIENRERELRELTASLEQKVEERTEELRLRNVELTQMATTDPLTKINNRRRFFELASNEYERSKRYQHPLSLLICDADYFKEINDTYGHQMGDRVLVNLANFLQKNIRSVDVVARYGGEEFIILMPEIGCEETVLIAERLRKSIAETPLAKAEQKILITVSFGVACWECKENLSLDSLLYRADKALYQAKRDGRNRVTLWRDNME